MSDGGFVIVNFVIEGVHKWAYRGDLIVGYNHYLTSGQELSNDLSSGERDSIEKEWGVDDVCLYPVEMLQGRREVVNCYYRDWRRGRDG